MNFYLSISELKNKSLNNFEKVVVRIYINDIILLTERTGLVGIMEILRLSKIFLDNLEIESDGVTPAQMKIYYKSWEYMVPAMNESRTDGSLHNIFTRRVSD